MLRFNGTNWLLMSENDILLYMHKYCVFIILIIIISDKYEAH